MLRRVQLHAGEQGARRPNKLAPKFMGPYEVVFTQIAVATGALFRKFRRMLLGEFPADED